MCVGRELERDARVDQRQAQEEIRRLFERYRLIGREPAPARADAPPEAEQRQDEPVLAAH
jgi:hypothetical protein